MSMPQTNDLLNQSTELVAYIDYVLQLVEGVKSYTEHQYYELNYAYTKANLYIKELDEFYSQTLDTVTDDLIKDNLVNSIKANIEMITNMRTQLEQLIQIATLKPITEYSSQDDIHFFKEQTPKVASVRNEESRISLALSEEKTITEPPIDGVIYYIKQRLFVYIFILFTAMLLLTGALPKIVIGLVDEMNNIIISVGPVSAVDSNTVYASEATEPQDTGQQSETKREILQSRIATLDGPLDVAIAIQEPMEPAEIPSKQMMDLLSLVITGTAYLMVLAIMCQTAFDLTYLVMPPLREYVDNKFPNTYLIPDAAKEATQYYEITRTIEVMKPKQIVAIELLRLLAKEANINTAPLITVLTDFGKDINTSLVPTYADIEILCENLNKLTVNRDEVYTEVVALTSKVKALAK